VAEGEDRLVPLACGRVVEGFRGVCVAAAALSDLDTLAGVLEECERRRLLLFVHPEAAVPGPAGWWSAVVGYTAQMQEAYFAWIVGGGPARWPQLPILFAALAGGAPFQLERLAQRGGDPSIP